MIPGRPEDLFHQPGKKSLCGGSDKADSSVYECNASVYVGCGPINLT